MKTFEITPLGEFCEVLSKTMFNFLVTPIEGLISRDGERYLADANHYISILRAAFPEKPWPQWAVSSFTRWNREVLREENYFKKHKRYSRQGVSLKEIQKVVYENSTVMEDYYLAGLYLSYFLWPHQYELLRFYREKFAAVQCLGCNKSVMEWGIGHGLLLLNLLERCPGIDACAYDISQFSIEFSKRLIHKNGFNNVEFRQADILSQEMEPVDLIICGELLEHIPNPELLIKKAKGCLKPGGLFFLTAAINAAQEDHVTLFRSSQEVLDLVGLQFSVESHVTLCHPNRAAEENPPEVLGMVLKAL